MVASRSASSRMIAADFPPSSRVTGRISRPHTSPIARPASVDPVNATLSTPGWLTRCAPAAASPGTTFSTPDGKPASAAASAKTSASKAVSGAALRMIGQPAARAGGNLHYRQRLRIVPWCDGADHPDRLAPNDGVPDHAGPDFFGIRAGDEF